MSWEFDFLNNLQLIRTDLLDLVMPLITALGNAGIFWILLSALLLVFPKTRRAGLASAISLILMLVIGNLTIKPLVARLRPFTVNTAIELLIAPPTDFSFPSGHTFASFASATALLTRSRKLGIPALVLAVLIAFSRLYLYVHYPTDVLAGVILGVLAGLLGSLIAERTVKRFPEIFP